MQGTILTSLLDDTHIAWNMTLESRKATMCIDDMLTGFGMMWGSF